LYIPLPFVTYLSLLRLFIPSIPSSLFLVVVTSAYGYGRLACLLESRTDLRAKKHTCVKLDCVAYSTCKDIGMCTKKVRQLVHGDIWSRRKEKCKEQRLEGETPKDRERERQKVIGLIYSRLLAFARVPGKCV